MFHKLEDVEARIEELDALLMNPAVLQNPSRLRDAMKERAHIAPIVELWQKLKKLETELGEAKSLRVFVDDLHGVRICDPDPALRIMTPPDARAC